MSESVSIEIYEIQSHHSRGWVSDYDHPWIYPNFEDCKPPDEIDLPGSEWCWVTNWRIDKKPGLTDEDGWEYASRYSRFKVTNRRPKTEKLWKDRARRRLWCRIMRREAGLSRNPDIALPKIQHGLSSIHTARMRIEEIMTEAPEAAGNEQMQSLVQSVRKNIIEISGALDQIEKQQQSSRGVGGSSGGGSSTQMAVIKKLRNDLAKEEIAIDRALFPGLGEKDKSKGFLPLRRQGSNSNNPPASSSVSQSYAPSSHISGFNSIPINGNNAASSVVGNSMNTSPILINGAAGSNTTSTALSINPDVSSSYNPNGGGAMAASLSTPRSLVKGGTAKHFNPSLLASNGTRTGANGGISSSINPLGGSLRWNMNNNNNANPFSSNGDEEDGVFVDRTMQERLIEQKLKPVDEATVMQEIIDDRAEEIKKVHKGISELQEMFNDLSKLVKEQQAEIDNIFKNVDESHTKTKEAFAHIVEANRLQKSGNCIIS